MKVITARVAPAVAAVLGFGIVCLGWMNSSAWSVALGAVAIGFAAVQPIWHARQSRREQQLRAAPVAPVSSVRPAAACQAIDPSDTEALAEQMLAQGRFALLLRPQIAANLSEDLFQRALRSLEESMALVPDGEVALGREDDGESHESLPRTSASTQRPRDETGPSATAEQGRVVRVKRFFLDRFAVTNAQYYEFVEAGGYRQLALWDEPIWPAVLDFVDGTGKPGPRYWRDGCYLPGEENHPVVGVCWYEAVACARWLGKRLPSDPEWVKGGSWPVAISPTDHVQRKYPWGDTMDRARANLWGSGPNGIVPVDAFAEGVSVGGVYQLIGNVWQWTSGNFHNSDHPAGALLLPTAMKSIRGGAFDTYFDNQATCHFQSGENPLRRRHNIGFRCAVGVCDLLMHRDTAAHAPPAAEEPSPLAEEVHA